MHCLFFLFSFFFSVIKVNVVKLKYCKIEPLLVTCAVHPSGANSEVTRPKRSQVTGSALVENQHYAGQKKGMPVICCEIRESEFYCTCMHMQINSLPQPLSRTKRSYKSQRESESL